VLILLGESIKDSYYYSKWLNEQGVIIVSMSGNEKDRYRRIWKSLKDSFTVEDPVQIIVGDVSWTIKVMKPERKLHIKCHDRKLQTKYS
jgi:hypothetical protein